MEEEETTGASERPPPRPAREFGALNLDNFPSPWMSPLRRRNPRLVSLSENGFSLSLGGGEGEGGMLPVVVSEINSIRTKPHIHLHTKTNLFVYNKKYIGYCIFKTT